MAPALRPLASFTKRGGTIATRAWLFIPLFALYIAANTVHGAIRALAAEIAPIQPQDISHLDVWTFRGVPSVWLQDWMGTAGLWADAAFAYWTTLFWGPTLLVMLVLAVKGPIPYLRLLLLHATVILAADVIYALVPTRPPWMDVDVVRVIALQTDGGVSVDRNPYAALPSLHIAVPVAYMLWFRGLDAADPLRRIWPVLAAWSVGMTWCVVYTGEHYVADVLAGYAWAGLAYFTLSSIGLMHGRKGAPGPSATSRADVLNEGDVTDPPARQAA
jgi:hypothetical protein